MDRGVRYSSGGTSQRLGFLSWEPVAWKLHAKQNTVVIFAARIWWCLGLITYMDTIRILGIYCPFWEKRQKQKKERKLF